MERIIILIILLSFSLITVICAQQQGKYFSKKKYIPQPIPNWTESKNQLPQPILADNTGWIEMYWKCWEIAFRGFKTPDPESPFVSNWLDEAFSENIFQWDTIFMIMFARYGHDVFPAIESLDNFYCRQQESGYIGREYREIDGKLIHFDFDGGLFSEKGWKNTINPPLFSWAEVESYRITGDKSRFEMILPVLEKYAGWLNRDGDPDADNWETNGRISKFTNHKLYWNTPLGSGMDNTPRPSSKGAGWVEMSAQMVIMYNNLAIICDELEKIDKAVLYRKEAQAIGDRINKWCWNDADGFYYDVLSDGYQFKKKTIGGFWPLLAGVASKAKAKILFTHLKNEKEFWRKIVFPSLSADEKEYHDYGDYWLGGVWAPTNVMVIKGLEKYGYEDFAAEATERYLSGMYEVFQKDQTVHENYAPEHFAPGNRAKKDFVGWTGCGPIQLLFENVMGLRPDGAKNTLNWRLKRSDLHGVKNLNIGKNTVFILCNKRLDKNSPVELTVECAKSFLLKVSHPLEEKIFHLNKGKHSLKIGKL